jgi:hypothetical protein
MKIMELHMTCRSRTIGTSSLAAFAGLAMAAITPALAQNQGRYTPPTQTYQNDPNSAINAGGMNGDAADTGMMSTSSATEPLTQVQNAKTTLASAQVQDSNGRQVGQVSNVHTSGNGQPIKVDVTLNSNNGNRAKTVSVKATELSYDRNSNTLITNLSADQLDAMPAASSTSGM